LANGTLRYRTNAAVQAALFVPIVQLPAFFTSKLIYVDIGWPLGLCCIAATALAVGQGWWARRWISAGLLFLHGVRMAVGAIVMFGQASNFTFRFDEDLPRYRFARVRWEKEHGMPASRWWIKVRPFL
jgi:steroid 5-alpha reductase family enzyme